jgi:hypothetical protein
MRRIKRIRRQSPFAIIGGASLAAIAGFALGAWLMHNRGGLPSRSGRRRRVRNHASTPDQGAPDSVYEMDGFAHADDDYGSDEDEIEEEPGEEAAASEVERRVLSAFMSDPILAALPVEIGAESDGVVELRGWVDSGSEKKHAAIIAGGVPGVIGVANAIRVRRHASAGRK